MRASAERERDMTARRFFECILGQLGVPVLSFDVRGSPSPARRRRRSDSTPPRRQRSYSDSCTERNAVSRANSVSRTDSTESLPNEEKFVFVRYLPVEM